MVRGGRRAALGLREWALIAASATANLLYLELLMRGYAASDLSVVYPVARGTGPLVSALGALLLFGERLAPLAAAGVAAVVAGVFLVAGGPALWREAQDPARRRRLRAGLAYGAATGLMIAAYTLVDGYAVKVAALSPMLVMWLGNVARLPVMLLRAGQPPRALWASLRRHGREAVFVAVAAPLGYLLVLAAMRLAPLSHVAPAREVSMLFVALAAGTLLGEGDRGPRLAGAGCIAAGVAALALA